METENRLNSGFSPALICDCSSNALAMNPVLHNSDQRQYSPFKFRAFISTVVQYGKIARPSLGWILNHYFPQDNNIIAFSLSL